MTAMLACGLTASLSVRGNAPTQTSQALDLFDLGAPSFTSFTTRDGLPDPVAVTVRTDRQGVVWAGTPHGLAWYDGKRWHALEQPELAGYINQLFVDSTGTLWACGTAFGLARYDGKHWHVETADDGLTSRNVRRLVETMHHGKKRLWAVSPSSGLFYREHDHWQADPGNAQLPLARFLTLAQTQHLFGHERLWLGTLNRGLWYRENDGPWQQYNAAGLHAGSGLAYLLATDHDGDDALWISVFNAGLWRLDGRGLHHWSAAAGDLPTDVLYNMVETPVGNGGHALWASSRNGLIRIYRDKVQVFDRRYGLPSNAIRGLSVWRSPNGSNVLWAATEDGVARVIVDEGKWKTVSLLGAHQTGVLSVLVDHDDAGNQRLWVGSDGDGLALYQHDHWRYYKVDDGQSHADISMIARAEDSDGVPALWIGAGPGELLQVSAGLNLKPLATPWPHQAGQRLNKMLSRRSDGRVEQWFATDASGIYRRRDGQWTAYRPQGVTGNWSVQDLLAQTTAYGRSWLWATTDQGLARFDGKQWVQLGHDIGLPGLDLLGIALIPDARGRPILWLGSTRHGIIRVDISDPLQPRTLPADLPPPPDLTADGAMVDRRGRIYVCTDSGVQLLTPDNGSYSSQVFTIRDGMVNNECNRNAQFIDTQDRFWTGTLGGLMVHDPDPPKPDRDAKPLKLVQASIDGKSMQGDHAIIPPGQHELRVDFALLSWRHEEESRFRTWLEGFSKTPGAWTPDNFREVGALPAGSYVLHIEARDYAGNLSTPIRLPITVEPWWWQRPWARWLFAAACAIAVYGMLRWRTHALRRRQSALERRIDARTSELNHANQQLLELSRRDALTGVFNRRWLMESLKPETLLENHHHHASLIFIDVDHFKVFNDNLGHLAGDQALRFVARTIDRCTPPHAIVARYGGEEFACLLFNLDLAAAHVIAEKIRVEVARRAVQVNDRGSRHVTISAGVAWRPLDSESAAEDLLRAADEAQYEAKRAGRNCVRDAPREA